MGNLVSTAHAQQLKALRRSANIDRIIEEDSRQTKREHKILLLGSSESGNSTVLKQMKFLHQGGFSPDERITYRATIYQNLLESAQAIVSTMSKLPIESVDAEIRKTADQIAHYDLDLSSIDSDFRFPEQLVSSINRLWRDPVIPQIVGRRGSEFYLADNIIYFLIEAERIGSADYTPNDTDILRCWKKSTGIVEIRLDAPSLSIRMLDVGGLRSQRKKWIHYFEDAIASIVFCTPLSDYDEVLPEDLSQNRMAESLVLFDSIINSRWFLRTSIILFLTKIDEFRDKLPKVPLEWYFPEYTDGPDVDAAASYILDRFVQANRSQSRIYAHLMQEIDASAVRFVFSAVQDIILQNALRECGRL